MYNSGINPKKPTTRITRTQIGSTSKSFAIPDATPPNLLLDKSRRKGFEKTDLGASLKVCSFLTSSSSIS